MLGCANRGMVAPGDGSAPASGGSGGKTDGGAGNGGHGGSAGTGGHGGGGHGGAAGSGGKGGSAGISGQDAGCGFLADAQVEHSTTSCTAMFNFETGIQGATIPVGTQAAFTSVTTSGAQTYCGTGALALAASFSGTTGNTTKGEVDLPLGVDGGTADLVGKTVTIHVSANPACTADLKFNAILNTTTGESVILRVGPLTANWTTASIKLPAATDGGDTSATTLALEVSEFTGYKGTIYIDEVDIR
jgi:hypothetical protein